MARNKFDIDETLDTQFNLDYLKRVIHYIKPYKYRLMLTISLMIVSTTASLLGPYLIKEAIDVKIPKKDVQGLVILAAVFMLTLIVIAVCSRFRIRLIFNTGQSIVRDIRLDLFKHMQKLSFTYFDSRPHGKILVRIINYVNSIGDLLSNGIVTIVIDVLSLVFIVIFMFAIDSRLTLICLLGLPVLMVTIFLIKNRQRKTWQIVSAKQSNLNAYIHENITGVKVTQSFTREEKNLDILTKLGANYKNAWMDAVSSSFILSPIIESISVTVTCLIFMAGVWWFKGGITLGVLIAFTSYASRFWGPINSLSGFYNSIINAMAYLERILELMDEKPLVADSPDAVEMPLIKGKIEFRNVVFTYEEGGRRILDNISFEVEEGESIALVGPTGAGKTTIVNLISRFYDIKEGEVLIDGIDIRGVTLKSLRKQMGIMLQDTFVFSGTVIDNIKYGKLDATEQEVIDAAKAVMAHDFIAEMKNGYNTEVTERGSTFSAGQRQLLSFARTLIANPRILILDEATSSIDTKTEFAIQKGLETLLKGRTSFIIAHRLSTIKNATRIMYIDNGKIIEQGTHDELIAKNGPYWKLYTSQYAEDDLPDRQPMEESM